jgi:hypothetical protein
MVLVPVTAVRYPQLACGSIGIDLTRAQIASRHGISDFDARSAIHLLGYAVEVRDGMVGRLEDILVEDSSWSISHLVLHARERRVLVSPLTVAALDSITRVIRLSLDHDGLRRLPPAPEPPQEPRET